MHLQSLDRRCRESVLLTFRSKTGKGLKAARHFKLSLRNTYDSVRYLQRREDHEVLVEGFYLRTMCSWSACVELRSNAKHNVVNTTLFLRTRNIKGCLEVRERTYES